MWKAAFTGRSESGGGNGSLKPEKEESRRKKSSHSNRAESVVSSTSRREDKDRERRRKERPGSLYDNGSSASRYENGSAYMSGESQYATAPTSRVGEPRPLTASALRMLPDDEEEWEDEDRDARSERKSRRKDSGDEKRRKSQRSEKERSRSRSRERKDKKKDSKSDKSRDKERERLRREPELVGESSRAIPEMGSFEQFPGQYGPAMQQDALMSGALPSPAPQQQFPGQDPYARPQMPPSQPTRADSYGAAAEYYLDEGQSVNHQPGIRPLTPNMLTNPDLDHLVTASSEAHPVQDTGNGSAADFYSGKVSPIPYNNANTPQKPIKPGKQSSSSSKKPNKPSRTSSSSTGAAAAALASGAAALSSSHRHSQSHNQTTSSSFSSSRPISKPSRHNSDGSTYYAPPSTSTNGTYPPTLPSTNGYGPAAPSYTGTPGKQSTNSNNIPLYAGAAAAAGAAGYAAYEYNQHQNNSQSQHNTSYNMSAAGGYGGGSQGPPRSPRPGAGGSGYYPPHGSNGGMAQMPYHEHKGPMSRLKDGLLNLISTPEDTAKMEMYTEYIGVCKHCFDPRTSAWDAPRSHHYHKRHDSFEDLRRRKSNDKMRRKGSDESLRRQGSTRVDKDNRYYASESSRKKRESGGTAMFGAGLAAAGAAGVANAMFSDRKNFDDTYSVKSGHRESSAVRRRSRSSSREQRRRSTYGVVRPEEDQYVTVRKKDGTVERRKVARKSRSSSRERKSSGWFGAAATGAALGAAGMAASSRRHSNSRSRSRSPTVLGGYDSRSGRRERRSPNRSSYYDISRRDDRPQESQGMFGGFFSPPEKKRRNSREHRKKRQGFFTFSNSSESSHDDLAFGDGFASRTSLPLRRKSSTMSNRSGRTGKRTSRKKSDDHLEATFAGIGATAAALAAAQKGHRISKRTSRPELGKRREPRYDTHDSSDDGEWEDELPSDVDDESVDGGLAFGDDDGRRLSGRQSMESIGSQSSAGGPLSAWGWRWGNKEQRRGRRRSSDRPSYPANGAGSFVAPGLSNAGSMSGASYDPSRPINKPVYLDDTGRPLPSISSESTVTSGPQGPMQYVDPAPLSEPGSRHASMPGAFDAEPPIIRPGPGPIQQPQPITPIQPSFTQSPPDINSRPAQPRRANSSPTRGHFAQDAALIGAAALGTAGIIAGSSMASGRRSKEPSNVRFGLTEEQQRKEDRERKKVEQKSADEARRKADRTRALKEEADRAAKESRQEEIRQAREDENRRRAEEKLREQRDADERAERERQKEQARIERERLEREARDRQQAAAAAAAEVERLRHEREEAQRNAEMRERERREREDADAREQARVAEEHERYAREQQDRERYERDQRDDDHRHSSASRWAPVAVGAAAAATVGAAIASEKNRDRKSRDDSYYDDAHRDRRDRDYGIEEVQPQHAHDGEPIMDDDVFDRDLFKRKQKEDRTSEELENDPRYVEFARRAADKVAADRNRSHSPGKDKYTTYADFFMPEELLNRRPEDGSKVRDVSPNADNEIAVWHARDAEIRSHFPQHPSDYGYGRTKHAPYGVPKLNVISPTPPPESRHTSPTSTRSGKGSKSSPLASSQNADEEEAAEELSRSQTSNKSERSRSISWGEDKTHFYDVDTPTPDAHSERESYVTSPDLRGHSKRFATGAAAAVGAAAAGAALHDIIVEEPSGESHRYSEEDWLRDEEREASRRGRKVSKDDEGDVEDITPSPEPQPDRQGFYRQPFFDSVSDMGTGIFNFESPGHEGAPPVRGFVEGEVDETPANEKAPRIPGGFDDDDPISAEIKKEQSAQASAGAAKDIEEPAWEPPLSKKEKKKREKAAKRSESLVESDPPTPATETPVSAGRDLPAEDAEYFPTLSKKDKKKLEKEAKKQGVGFADLVSQLHSGKSQSEVATPEEPLREEPLVEEPAWEPPLSKKEQKKRDKEAKKSGFADVADEILAAGGIAAAAAAATGVASAAMDSTEDSAGGSGSGKKKKKGKKAKLGEPLERDPRDLEVTNDVPPSAPEAPTFGEEPSGMPGAWDDDRRDSTDQSPSETTVDPFQYEVRDPETVASESPDAREVDSWAEWSQPSSGSKKSKKDKKKSKRGSVAFDTLPEVSSPLRAEIPQDDYMGSRDAGEEMRSKIMGDSAAYVNGTTSRHEDAQPEPTPVWEEKLPDDRSRRETTSFENGNRTSESPRRVSPDDIRSVISAPEAGDRRKSKRDEARRGSDYSDEPSYAYETQSVAASEPADYERERKSKRRSKQTDDFDDTASVTSSRSRREKEESPSSSKKEKKGGLFGLFSRKSYDEKSSKDGASLSRESTRDDDDESRRRRKHRSTSEYGDDDDDTRSVKSESRRKHRSQSEYGDDDDDTRSVKSESRRKHRSHSERGDEESRERGKRSSRSYDDYDRERASPARSEPSTSRHHHRRRTDEDGESLSRKDSRESRSAVSESGHKHHRRRRTDDDYDSKDQSFLGKRVEDLPPLPASPDIPDSAAVQGQALQQEQGEGSPVSAESVVKALVNDGKDVIPSGEETARDVSFEKTPETPSQLTPSIEAPQRPGSLNRPVSSTAVPLRFPFGHAPPQTPSSLKERAHSFSSPLATPTAATSSPSSPASTTKQSRQGRPHSTEIRPLYLVERNRQTPEVDEGLPSLPSSKPSSRASSVHGSDENYHSATEEWNTAESPSRRRALTVDIGEAQRWNDEGDMLDSQQTTPKASEFPQLPTGERQHPKQEPQFYTWEDLAREEQPKQQPQFYTWEDFAQDEKMHEAEVGPAPSVGERQEPSTSSRSRSVSPAKKHGHGSKFKSVAAAAMLGTAAVYAGHKLSERSPERSERDERRGSRETTAGDEVRNYPLPAPLEESAPVKGPSRETEKPELSRQGSSKKKKGKKGKKAQWTDEPETPATPSEVESPAPARTIERADTNAFFDKEAQAEAGAMDPEPLTEIIASAPTLEHTNTREFFNEEAQAEEGAHRELASVETPWVAPKENALDRFLHDEKDMEEGAVFASAVAHSMPVLPSPTADKSTEGFVEAETRREAGEELAAPVLKPSESHQEEERPSTAYKIPTAKAEPAPLVIEERNVLVENEEPAEIEPAPRLTRKQSKKAKKQQRAASLFTDEPAQDDESSKATPEPVPEESAVDEIAEMANVSTPAIDKQREEQDLTEDREAPLDISEPTTAVETAPQVSFGMPDFSNVAHDSGSSWNDAQAQTFSDSMIKPNSAEAAALDAPREAMESMETPELSREADADNAESFEPAVSKKKTKKDKKKKPPTWSEPEAEEAAFFTEPPLTDVEPSQLQEQASRDVDGGDGFATGVAATAGAVAGAALFETAKSKKKAKKDKKKKPPTWSEADDQGEPASQVEPAEEARAEPEEPESFGGTSRKTDDFDVQPPSEPATESEPKSAEKKLSTSEDVAIEQPEEFTVEPEQSPEQQTAEEAFPIVSKKKSKKDKKKKNAPTWADAEPEVESAEQSGSTSRQMSFDESAFVDASESWEPSNEPADIAPEDKTFEEAVETTTTETVQPEVSTPQDDLETFAPVSKKRGKKGKKKQAFDWTEPEPESSPVTQTEDARDAEAVDQEVSQAPAEDPITPFEDTATSDKDVLPLPDPAHVADETVRPEDPAGKDATEEFASVSSKKSKRDKKKKRQTFDWTDPEPEVNPEPNPQATDVDGVSKEVNDFKPIEESSAPKADLPVAESEQQSHDTFEFHPAEELSKSIGEPEPSVEPVDTTAAVAEIAQPEETTAKSALEEFAPSVSKKKSKKDKKQQKQAFDWNEPEAEAPPLSESRDELATVEGPFVPERQSSPEAAERQHEPEQSTPAQDDTTRDVDTTQEEPSAVVGPAEPAVEEEFKPTLSRKQSKKDKKKKKLEQLWEPESEAQPEADKDASIEPTSTEATSQEQPATETTEDTDGALFDAAVPDEVAAPEQIEERADKIEDNEAAASNSWDVQDAQVEEPPTAPQDEPQEDFSWISSSKKKGKKGKKGRKSEPDTPPVQEEPGAGPSSNLDQETEPHEKKAPQSWDGMVTEEQGEALPSTEVETPAPEAAAEAEADTEQQFAWTSGSKKRSKKGKKSRQQSLAGTDFLSEEPAAEAQVETAQRDAEDNPETQLESNESTSEGQILPVDEPMDTALSIDRAAEDAAGQDVFKPADIHEAGDQTQIAAKQPAEDDWWSFPTSSKKKGKKGKKGKSSGTATPVPEVPEPTAQGLEAGDDRIVQEREEQPSTTEMAATIVDDTQTTQDLEAPTSEDRETKINESIEASQDLPIVETDKRALPEEAQEEFSWAPSSKKKGKKGKKSKASAAETPLAEESDPIDSTAQAEPSLAVADLAGGQPKDTGEPTEEPQAEDADSFWAMPTSSKKKKGKKSKKSGSELATPTTEPAEPPFETPLATEQRVDESDGPSRDVLVESAEPKVETSVGWDAPRDMEVKPVETEITANEEQTFEEIPPYEPEEVEAPADSTFADVWAEEEIATTEDQDAVRDLMDEPKEDAPPLWTSSKKGKKGKKGKRASIADQQPAASQSPTFVKEPEAETTTNSQGNPEVAHPFESEAQREPEPFDNSTGHADKQDEVDADFWSTPQTSKKNKKGKKSKQLSWADEPGTPLEEPQSGGLLNVDQSSSLMQEPEQLEVEKTALAEEPTIVQDTAAQEEPAADVDDWFAPQTGKKKGKKGKQLTFDEPEPTESTTQPEASFSQEPEQSEAERTISGEDSLAAQESTPQEAPTDADDWSVPQTGKKKGKKGKKGKQITFDDEPEPSNQSAQPESNETTTSTEETQPTSTVVAEEPQPQTQAEADDFWAVSTKGKKGKKTKKEKQVVSWGDEQPAESTHQPAMEDEQAAVVGTSWDVPESVDRDLSNTGEQTFTRPLEDKAEKMPQDQTLPAVSETPNEWTQEVPDSNSETPVTIFESPEEIAEPRFIGTPQEGPDAAQEPPTSAPQEESSDFTFTTKKSKKDKKKGKKSRSSIADPWAETAEEPSTPSADLEGGEKEHDRSIEAAAAATAIATGAVIAEATKTEPEEDDWAGFSSKKSKKAKKAKKSGTSTPAFEQDDQPVEANTDVVDFAPAAPIQPTDNKLTSGLTFGETLASDSWDQTASTGNAGLPGQPWEERKAVNELSHSQSQEQAPNDRQQAADEFGTGSNKLDEYASSPTTDRSMAWDEATRTSSPHHPSQDIDFTATVAAGLADSGFNPDMVINDPVFQRRASPPGAVAEADPEEGFASTTTKRKKGKKGKKSSESPAQEPAFPAVTAAGDSLATDDFKDTVSQGLQGTGFDPVLLEKALASSTEASKDVTEPEEFSFATTKRKKGKKAVREEEEASSENIETPSNDLATEDIAKDAHNGAVIDNPTAELHDSAPNMGDTEASADSTGQPSATQGVDILTVGRDEMDMDEMDRAYKAYKKNKRKQKKLKGSRTAGASDNPESAAEDTERSALVSENEGLSRNTTMDNAPEVATSRELVTQPPHDESMPEQSAETEKSLDAVTSAMSPTSPTSVVHSAFPGLERVKRRAPPPPRQESETSKTERSQSPPRADPAFGTAGMAAVVAAAARERKARKDSDANKPAEASRGAQGNEPAWSFAALDDQTKDAPESPIVGSKEHQPIRDSGYQETTRSPQRVDRSSRELPRIVSTSSSRESLRERRSLEPLRIPTSPEQEWDIKVPKKRSREHDGRSLEPHSRTPSAETPLKPTSKDRASYLFSSPPEGLAGVAERSPQPAENRTPKQRPEGNEYFHSRSRSRETDDRPSVSHESPRDRSTFSPPPTGPMSPRQALDSIPEEHHASKRSHAPTDIGGPEHIKAIKRAETPQDIRIREQALSPSLRPHVTIPSGSTRSTSNPLSTDELINRLSWPSVDEHYDTVNLDRQLGHRHSRPALPDPRSPSVMSNRSNTSGAHFRSPQELRSYSRTSNRSQESNQSLRRVSLSGDLRAASRRGDSGSAVGARASPITIPFEAPPTPPLNDDEVIDGSASRAADMNDDVFQGYGDAQQSQVSPTRPPSVRKRQSMHINDLESRVDQLVAENRALQEARAYAEETNDAARDVNGQALQEALTQRDLQIQEKDVEINKIKTMLQPLQEEIARLSEINGGLTEANRNLVEDANGRYATLQQEHSDAHEQWQSTNRELESMRHEHGRITSGMKDIVEAEIANALADKNAEILRLREQLDIAAEQIRALQVQIQSSKSSDFLMQRDEDYFDGSCQKLCQHVQQWVLRFSKLSDNRVCRISTDLNDDKIEARLDNAVLDGSDVDKLLGDRVRRRDVFMSLMMTMVWEYVFTRYLFGMDREQRQKLKALEKLLAEVGPPRAVSHWRATTLTLLSKRPTFESQCAQDTEAVAQEIFSVLCSLLPPPSSSERQLLESLTKVIRIAVDLSVEMRTQRAEYIMLPPLQPEYDTNGDLVRKVHFNASLMNERSGFFGSNEELAAQNAVVKIVLFPLVVKKGDDVGEGEEEIVVCPAQVLVQNDKGKGQKRVVRVLSGAMEIDDPIRNKQSRGSLMSEAPGSVQF